jgi:hypothetical protein
MRSIQYSGGALGQLLPSAPGQTGHIARRVPIQHWENAGLHVDPGLVFGLRSSAGTIDAPAAAQG